MFDTQRVAIHYPIALLLLTAAYLFLFSEPIVRPPIYYTANGKVVVSNSDIIPVGTQLVRPFCRLTMHDGNVPEFVCKIEQGTEAVLPGSTLHPVDFLRIFYIPVIISFMMFLFAAWFVDSRRDFLIASFFFWSALFIVLSLHTILYETGIFLWYFVGCLIPVTLLNLHIRISGRFINARILIAETVIIGFLTLFLIVADDPKRIEAIPAAYHLILFLFWLLTIASVLIQSVAVLDQSNDPIDRIKKAVAAAGTLIGVGIPIGLVAWAPGCVPAITYLILCLVFPLSLIYGTYRMHMLPFQFLVTRSLAAAFLTSASIAIYAIVLYAYSLLLPNESSIDRWIINTLFLLLFVFLLDPLRTFITTMIEKRLLLPQGEHSESLKRLAEIISKTSRPQVAVQAILSEINQTLGIQRSYFATVPDFFFYLDLREQHVIRLPQTSPVWSLLSPEKMQFTSYLNYGSGARKELFEFLYHKRILLAIGLGERRTLLQRLHSYLSNRINRPLSSSNDRLSSALLVGYPEERTKLYLRELRYLQEAGRLAGMMLYNMHALLREVDKRKRVRDLQQSGHYQKLYTLKPDTAPLTINYQFFNRPVISVTGDYIDVINLRSDRIAFFLGDVSGHGLGTGFLVSALRSIVRTASYSGKSLKEILNILNEFLTDRYSGYEFLTLFAMILNLQDGKIEYINAAHPGAFLKLADSPIEKLENTQRLLGILPGEYKSFEYQAQPGQRIFLFSDGVLETANTGDEFFGEQRLADFLSQHGNEPLDDIVAGLRQTLESFRGMAPPGDDTSFLAIEYLPNRSIFNIILRGLGIKR